MSWLEMRWVAEEAVDLFERAHGPQTASPSNGRFARDLMETWILANVLAEYDALLCSPSGKILRAPDMVCLHGDRLDYCSWSPPVDKDASFNFFFERSAAGAFTWEDLEQRFCFLDAASGRITLKNNSVSLLMGATTWHDRLMEKAVPDIKELLGHAICWNPVNLPKTIEELMSPIGLELPAMGVAGQAGSSDDEEMRADIRGKRNRGRPSMVPLILEAYDDEYPNGHQIVGVTWDQVTGRLMARTGKHLRADHVAKTVNRRSDSPRPE